MSIKDICCSVGVRQLDFYTRLLSLDWYGQQVNFNKPSPSVLKRQRQKELRNVSVGLRLYHAE